MVAVKKNFKSKS